MLLQKILVTLYSRIYSNILKTRELELLTDEQRTASKDQCASNIATQFSCHIWDQATYVFASTKPISLMNGAFF